MPRTSPRSPRRSRCPTQLRCHRRRSCRRRWRLDLQPIEYVKSAWSDGVSSRMGGRMMRSEGMAQQSGPKRVKQAPAERRQAERSAAAECAGGRGQRTVRARNQRQQRQSLERAHERAVPPLSSTTNHLPGPRTKTAGHVVAGCGTTSATAAVVTGGRVRAPPRRRGPASLEPPRCEPPRREPPRRERASDPRRPSTSRLEVKPACEVLRPSGATRQVLHVWSTRALGNAKRAI